MRHRAENCVATWSYFSFLFSHPACSRAHGATVEIYGKENHLKCFSDVVDIAVACVRFAGALSKRKVNIHFKKPSRSEGRKMKNDDVDGDYYDNGLVYRRGVLTGPPPGGVKHMTVIIGFRMQPVFPLPSVSAS